MSKTLKIVLAVAGAIIALAITDMLFFVTPLDQRDVDTIALYVDGANEVSWKWLDGPRNWWGERHGLCASYRAISNTVVIPRYMESVATDPVMIPTYVHELTHAKDRREMGFFKYEYTKILNRSSLERRAEQAEQEVQP